MQTGAVQVPAKIASVAEPVPLAFAIHAEKVAAAVLVMEADCCTASLTPALAQVSNVVELSGATAASLTQVGVPISDQGAWAAFATQLVCDWIAVFVLCRKMPIPFGPMAATPAGAVQSV